MNILQLNEDSGTGFKKKSNTNNTFYVDGC